MFEKGKRQVGLASHLPDAPRSCASNSCRSSGEKLAKTLPVNFERRVFADTGITAYRLAA